MSEDPHYPPRLIALLEAVWGQGFLSPGGTEEVARVMGGHNLTGLSVLDIGCGAGGIDIALVAEHRAGYVTALDVEDPVLDHARGRVAACGLAGPDWSFKAALTALGVANGAFAVAAIGAMMGLASSGRESREGTRMGLWGAAQAVAFGMGGLVGTGASDLAHWWLGAPGLAYSAVFAFEAALFVLAAWLALRAVGDASTTSADRATPHEAPHRGATVVSTPRLSVRDPQAGDAPVAIIKSS